MATPNKEVKEVVKYIEVERKKERPEKENMFAAAPKSEWVYVSIPKEDLHGYPYAPISINSENFNTNHMTFHSETDDSYVFFVPPVVAGEISRIVKRNDEELISLLQPKKRMLALRQLAGNRGATRVATAAGGAVAQSEGIPGAVVPA